jgi:sugar phosphate isomerase/epimerase
MYSRRELLQLALAAAPATAYAAKLQTAINGIHIGCITYNWRDLPSIPGAISQADAWIKVLTEIGIREVELFNLAIQPIALAAPPAPAGSGTPTPEQLKERQDARQRVREWRLKTPMSEFVAIRKKFDRAGIFIDSYGCNMADDYTDEELDKHFLHAKALGVKRIAISTQMAVARRVVPFAEKHKMVVAFHNSSNVGDPNQVASLESLEKIYAMSKFFRVNLDLGHMTAANIDALDYVRKNYARISFLHFNDRKKTGGTSVPYGQGDAPFKEVLQLLRKEKQPLTCILEVDQPIPQGSTTAAEWKRCFEYLKQAVS